MRHFWANGERAAYRFQQGGAGVVARFFSNGNTTGPCEAVVSACRRDYDPHWVEQMLGTEITIARRRIGRIAQAVIGALALAMTGCVGHRMPGDPSPPRTRPHIVWLFPGIEGGPIYLAAVERALDSGGVRATYRRFDWRRLLGLDNLTDYAGNLRRASEAARNIAEDCRSQPDAIVDVVGYSGGGGIALLALRELPPDAAIRNLVLVQPAVSPDFDLTAVLDRVTGTVVHIYSPADSLILGVGTRTFGTIDRKHVDAAGRFGFDESCAVPRVDQRSRLLQQPWVHEMRDFGHAGDHFGMISARWNRRYVAPWLQ